MQFLLAVTLLEKILFYKKIMIQNTAQNCEQIMKNHRKIRKLYKSGISPHSLLIFSPIDRDEVNCLTLGKSCWESLLLTYFCKLQERIRRICSAVINSRVRFFDETKNELLQLKLWLFHIRFYLDYCITERKEKNNFISLKTMKGD